MTSPEVESTVVTEPDPLSSSSVEGTAVGDEGDRGVVCWVLVLELVLVLVLELVLQLVLELVLELVLVLVLELVLELTGLVRSGELADSVIVG